MFFHTLVSKLGSKPAITIVVGALVLFLASMWYMQVSALEHRLVLAQNAVTAITSEARVLRARIALKKVEVSSLSAAVERQNSVVDELKLETDLRVAAASEALLEHQSASAEWEGMYNNLLRKPRDASVSACDNASLILTDYFNLRSD